MVGYSSHDWRKNTDDAVVMDEHNTIIRSANDLKVRFKDKHGNKHEVHHVYHFLSSIRFSSHILFIHSLKHGGIFSIKFINC